MAHEAGKGSGPRPFSVDHDEYAKRWETIFGHKKNLEQQKQQEQPSEENKSENKN